MKQSILALVMALILCMSAVPVEVMAADDPGDASRSAYKISEEYKADDSEKAAEYAGDTGEKQTSSDGTAFNPYVFDVDENGENPRVELEPRLMSAAPDMGEFLLSSGNMSGVAGNDTADKGKTVSPEEFKIDDFKFNDSDLLMDLSWDRLEKVIDYNLIISIKKDNNTTDYLINIMHVIYGGETSSQESDLTYSVLNNQMCILNGVRIPVMKDGQEQLYTSEGINKANGIVYGDKVMLRLIPVVEDQIPAGPKPSGADVSFSFYGNESPPIPERAVYNLNDSLRMGFETDDLGSKYYEVVGLSEQNPDGSREPISINGTSFYVFGKSNVNRSDALIINKTIEGGGIVSDVSFNTTLNMLQFNGTSIMPAIGEPVYFAVRSENSGFGYPISDFVGCEVPVLKNAVIFNQTATVEFITNDVKMSYFDVYGFVEDEKGGTIPIGNSTYSEFGRLRCESKNAEYWINSTDAKGNTVSEIRISAPIIQFNETAEPVKPGDTLYFTVETEHGRDPDKAFNGDDVTDGFSNLVETVVDKKLTPVITAEDITKTAKAKEQSFELGASTDGGALSYNSSSASVTVDPDGMVTVKKNFIGKAVITVNSTETQEYESASKDVTITVKPAKAALKKVSNIKKRKVKATWVKSPVTSITGYQIRYSTSKKFPKSKKTRTKTIKGRKKTRAVISGLKKGKKYYFQIRTYKKSSEGKYYSDWSKSKSVKIKK